MLDAEPPPDRHRVRRVGRPGPGPRPTTTWPAYAPYENVGARDYPPILATTSLNDTRVLYVEAAKWVARLRATARRGHREFLLKTEMAAGHGGVSGATRPGATAPSPRRGLLDRMGWQSRRRAGWAENSLRVPPRRNSRDPSLLVWTGEGSERARRRESSRHPVRWSRCGRLLVSRSRRKVRRADMAARTISASREIEGRDSVGLYLDEIARTPAARRGRRGGALEDHRGGAVRGGPARRGAGRAEGRAARR